MRKKLILCVMLMLAGLTVTAAAMQREQQRLADKLIRLHVVANSDSERDQRRAALVRERIGKQE